MPKGGPGKAVLGIYSNIKVIKSRLNEIKNLLNKDETGIALIKDAEKRMDEIDAEFHAYVERIRRL